MADAAQKAAKKGGKKGEETDEQVMKAIEKMVKQTEELTPEQFEKIKKLIDVGKAYRMEHKVNNMKFNWKNAWQGFKSNKSTEYVSDAIRNAVNFHDFFAAITESDEKKGALAILEERARSKAGGADNSPPKQAQDTPSKPPPASGKRKSRDGVAGQWLSPERRREIDRDEHLQAIKLAQEATSILNSTEKREQSESAKKRKKQLNMDEGVEEKGEHLDFDDESISGYEGSDVEDPETDRELDPKVRDRELDPKVHPVGKVSPDTSDYDGNAHDPNAHDPKARGGEAAMDYITPKKKDDTALALADNNVEPDQTGNEAKLPDPNELKHDTDEGANKTKEIDYFSYDEADPAQGQDPHPFYPQPQIGGDVDISKLLENADNPELQNDVGDGQAAANNGQGAQVNGRSFDDLSDISSMGGLDNVDPRLFDNLKYLDPQFALENARANLRNRQGTMSTSDPRSLALNQNMPQAIIQQQLAQAGVASNPNDPSTYAMHTAAGDVLLNHPTVNNATSQLRQLYGMETAAAVIPTADDQIMSDIRFDMFDVVQPGFGNGATNKLFLQQEAWDRNIRYNGRLCSPGGYIGPINGVTPGPWQWQTVVPWAMIKKYVNHKFDELKNVTNTVVRNSGASTGILGTDDGFPFHRSSQDLRRNKDSVLEPVIRNDIQWQHTTIPAGYELNNMQFRPVTDAMRYPREQHTLTNGMGGPHLPKRSSLEVILP